MSFSSLPSSAVARSFRRSASRKATGGCGHQMRAFPFRRRREEPSGTAFFGNKKGETTLGPFVHALWLHGCGAEERKGERAAGWTDGLRGTTRFRGLPLQPAAKRASVQRPPLSGSGKLGDDGWIRVYVRTSTEGTCTYQKLEKKVNLPQRREDERERERERGRE